MRVIDCCIFAGELDMMEIRLKYYFNYVDLFVIVESNKSFQGGDKPYFLEENWKRFAPFHSKIEYIQIEQDPSVYTFNEVDRYSPDNGPFKMEYECRNSLMYANDFVENEDLVFLSDVDELWDRQLLYENAFPPEFYSYPVALRMEFYAFYLSNKTITGPDVHWHGTVVCNGKYWKNTSPQSLRDRRNSLSSIGQAGYHLSWMGGLAAIKNKIKSFAHSEYNREHILDDRAILSAIEEGRDVLQRPGISYQLQPMAMFPEDLRKVLEQYSHLIK